MLSRASASWRACYFVFCYSYYIVLNVITILFPKHPSASSHKHDEKPNEKIELLLLDEIQEAEACLCTFIKVHPVLTQGDVSEKDANQDEAYAYDETGILSQSDGFDEIFHGANIVFFLQIRCRIPSQKCRIPMKKVSHS